MSSIAPSDLLVIQQCLDQSGPWADGSILSRHEREADKGYARRKSCFRSPALYSYLINSLDVLYSHAPLRTGADPVYTAFLDSAGEGSDLSTILGRAAKCAMAQGSAYLVMDADPEQPYGLEEMMAGRTFPYLDLVQAWQVKDVIVDKVGRISRFTYQYVSYDADGSSSTLLRRFEAGMVTEYDLTGAMVSQRALPLTVGMPVIPVVLGGIPLKTGELPPSPTRSMYQSQKAIANTLSLMDESLFSAQFSVLVITGAVGMDDLSLGTTNGLSLPTGASASFISPSGTPVDLMLKSIENAVDSMVKTFANLISGDEAQSGIAKIIDRQVGAMRLKKYALELQRVEYEVYQNFRAFLGLQPDPAFTVTYHTDFDAADIVSYLTAGLDLLARGELGAPARKAIRQDLLRKFFAGMDPMDLVGLVATETENTNTAAPAANAPAQG